MYQPLVNEVFKFISIPFAYCSQIYPMPIPAIKPVDIRLKLVLLIRNRYCIPSSTETGITSKIAITGVNHACNIPDIASPT